jgi:hypothetical protein
MARSSWIRLKRRTIDYGEKEENRKDRGGEGGRGGIIGGRVLTEL